MRSARLSSAIFAVFIFVLDAASLIAQVSAASADVRVGGLVSVQPKQYEGSSSPYLNESLGGTVPGVTAALVLAPHNFPLLAFELSTTSSLVTIQYGRFVVAEGPVEARHRDTLLSFLTGVRVGRRPSLELKGGVSFLFGTPQREEFEFDDPAGMTGLTGGADLVMPLSDHISLVPTARYTFANRGDDGDYFGLGSHIFRAGVNVAFDLTR